MEEKKVDQRIRITKRILQENLLDMLADKPVERITVKALCDRSEINRSTFYAHYSDVFQLFREMCDELADDLGAYIQKMSAHTADVQQTRLMLEYIKEHSTVCTRLLFNSSYMNDRQPIQNRVQKETLEHIMGLYPTIDPKYQSYIIRYVFMGGNTIILHWIQSGFDLETEVLSKMIFGFSRAVVSTVIAYNGQE